MTTRKNKTANVAIEWLEMEVQRCLAELRSLGRRNKARRAALQARYAELGQQIREAYA